MITFLFGFNDIGGVQVLILNLIKELNNRGIRTKLIYFSESWLITELKRSKIEFEFLCFDDINKEKVNKFINPDDILVTTIMFKELVLFKEVDPYFLFWNVFPSTLDHFRKKPLFLRRIIRKELIRKMVRKNGIIFMDNTGVSFIAKQYRLHIKANLIPIPIGIDENNYFTIRILNRGYNDKLINITYLGRAVIWKVTPLLKVINDIKCCQPKNGNIVLHIITDDIEHFKHLMNSPLEGLNIHFYSGLAGEDLKKFLINKSDLHIATGTSCLEGSSLGIPSIMIDGSYTDFPTKYLYKWIYESKDHFLGDMVENIDQDIGQPLQEILSIYSNKNYDLLIDISKECYIYTKVNHDLKVVAEKFLRSCFNSKLKVRNVLYRDIYYLKMLITDKCN